MDEADRAGPEVERHLAEALRNAAKPMPAGVPGDCEFCGEWFGRLVQGACVPCRTRYKLP